MFPFNEYYVMALYCNIFHILYNIIIIIIIIISLIWKGAYWSYG